MDAERDKQQQSPPKGPVLLAPEPVHPGQPAELKPAPGSVLAEALAHMQPNKKTPLIEVQRKRKFAGEPCWASGQRRPPPPLGGPRGPGGVFGVYTTPLTARGHRVTPRRSGQQGAALEMVGALLARASEVFTSMRKHTSFPHDAHEDSRETQQRSDYPQTTSPSYRLAFADNDFLLREDTRPVRLSLEYQKVETCLREAGITGTIVVFGSARLKPGTIYYEQARELGKLLATKGEDYGVHIITGGGPGIMQAANHGAHEAGARTIGLNIVLPYEQRP
ncbi:MAG: hypothetical protein BJ554DRAFT_2018 [Olpidium bornovanus]|uniref:LOG family protein n=1 Tax=Olpidium bornovanus TaxID=278681 RepID=A0A8H7ZRI9_9FUNG|nr:MAG: hypothetical protein BJ554DRAFT_2018 [Olpidium bornovanus]